MKFLTAETAERFLAGLPGRTLADVLSLHYIQTPEEVHCLDLDLRAPTYLELNKLCLAKLRSMQMTDLMPGRPPDEWRPLLTMKLAMRYALKFRTGRGYWLGVAVLEAK